jgi:TM2 domain-containing membrane protein YozV
MKKLLSVLFFALITFSTQAAASDYYVDDSAIEDKLSSSTQVVFNPMTPNGDMMDITTVQASDPNAWVAFALAWVLGGLGIHRVYLGGKGLLILIYFITCGGIFGIVPLIDWIVLLVGAIQGDISQFVNNDKFFMWAG